MFSFVGKVKVNREKIICASTYYISVADDDQKADAFEGLLGVLDPSFIVVLVNSIESAYDVKRLLGAAYSCAMFRGGTQIDQTDGCSSTPRSAYIVVDQCAVPYFCSEKTLVVVYDSLPVPGAIQYNQSQDTTGVIPVYLVGRMETPPS